jgi:hypothetical protein
LRLQPTVYTRSLRQILEPSCSRRCRLYAHACQIPRGLLPPPPRPNILMKRGRLKNFTQLVRANANPAILYKVISHLLRESLISDTGLIIQKCRWQLYTPKTSYWGNFPVTFMISSLIKSYFYFARNKYIKICNP